MLSVAMCMPTCLPAGMISSAGAIDNIAARAFAGRDVHIGGDKLTDFHGGPSQDALLIEQRFSLVAGADTFVGDKAVVWVNRAETSGVANRASIWVYVSGKISAGRGKGTRVPGLNWQTVENGRAMVIWFEATGDVFLTAKTKDTADMRSGDFYGRAFAAVADIDKEFATRCGAVSPVKTESAVEPNRAVTSRKLRSIESRRKIAPKAGAESAQPVGAFGVVEQIFGPSKKPKAVEGQQPQAKVRYPVNLAPAGDIEPNIEATRSAAGKEIATIIGRFYLWQRQDEQGGLLEMQADAAVVFYSQEKLGAGRQGERHTGFRSQWGD